MDLATFKKEMNEVYGIFALWSQQVLPIWNAKGEGLLVPIIIYSQ